MWCCILGDFGGWRRLDEFRRKGLKKNGLGGFMGEVREVENLAFLTKKGLFGGKMAFHREHKTSQKAQRLRLALDHCACRRE